MGIFKTSTPADQVTKAEAQLAVATETHAQAVQALDSARLVDLGESPDPKTTERARKAVQAAAATLQDARETLALVRARELEASAAAADAEAGRAAVAKRARISALVKSRNRLAGSIDAGVKSIGEDWVQLAKEDFELVGLANGSDIWIQTLAPARLAVILQAYMGAQGLPFRRPDDVTTIPSFESVIVDTGNALIDRASRQGAL